MLDERIDPAPAGCWEVGLMPLGDLGIQSLGNEIWVGRAIAPMLSHIAGWEDA